MNHTPSSSGIPARPPGHAGPGGATAPGWSVLAATGVGTFMSAPDGSIVNAILPIVTLDFRSDVATIEWVITPYLLVQSGLLLAFGRLGDMRGHKAVYVWGFVVFIATAAFCGLAPTPLALAGARSLQAIGAAILIANSPAILTHAFPPQQRGRVLGLPATIVYVGLATGPPLGGWLAGLLGWRAVLYVNIPVGLRAPSPMLDLGCSAAARSRRRS